MIDAYCAGDPVRVKQVKTYSWEDYWSWLYIQYLKAPKDPTK